MAAVLRTRQSWHNFCGSGAPLSTAAPKRRGFLPSQDAALMLTGRNPEAAEHLVSRREMEGLNIRVLNAQLGTIVCKGVERCPGLPKSVTELEDLLHSPRGSLHTNRTAGVDASNHGRVLARPARPDSPMKAREIRDSSDCSETGLFPIEKPSRGLSPRDRRRTSRAELIDRDPLPAT